MKSDRISSRNLASLIVLIILSSSVLTGALNSRQDTWLTALIAGVIYLPIILVYCRLMSLHPGKGLYDIIMDTFGSKVGPVIIFLFCVYAILIACTVLRKYTEFAITIALQNTPRVVLMLVIACVSYLLAKSELEVMGRWGLIISSLIISLILITMIASYDTIEFSNIKPIKQASNLTLFQNAVTIGSSSIGESVLVLAMIGGIKKNHSPYKVYLWGLGVGVLCLAVVILRNALILGPYVAANVRFVSYSAVRIMHLGNFFERIESILAFNLTLMGITKLAVDLYAAAKGASSLLKIKSPKHIMTPMFLLLVAINGIMFQNLSVLFDFFWVYPVIGILFQAVFPIIMLVVSEFKQKGSVKPLRKSN